MFFHLLVVSSFVLFLFLVLFFVSSPVLFPGIGKLLLLHSHVS